MARTSYATPGVYVEEVPSAQQPIAAVGTNTVGFIGIVPDVIYYPEPNPDYDPVVAQAASRLTILRARVSEAKDDETKTKLDEEIKRESRKFDSEIERLNDKIAELNDKIAAREEDEKKAENDVEKDRASKELTDAREELKATQEALEELTALKERQATPASPDQELDESTLIRHSVLKPYILRKFEVKVAPYDTKLCTNFSEYASRFGDFSADFPEPIPNIPEVKALVASTHRALTHAVSGFFKNGGARCFVARIENRSQMRRALEMFESIDAIAIIAAPGLDGKDVWDELVAHCENCEDRFALLDCPESVEKDDGELDVQKLQYETRGNLLPQRSKNAAFYFPYIEVVDPAKQLQDEDPVRGVDVKYRGRLYAPPSGHIAGVYARTDEERGVHKAPANTAVLGALNVKYYISKAKQELLNPQGVNCIRDMNGNITVWGARTIGGDKNGEWKYINVRRFFLFLKESIDEGTQWIVFEPNDPSLWGKIRRNITAFLTNVWRAGALFGTTPEEAFYVKCDAELNPPEVRDVGQVVTEIGVAIVRPAEFVIFRVTQSTGPRTS